MLTWAFRLEADGKTMLIELDQRPRALPSSVRASGAIVVGALDGGVKYFPWRSVGARAHVRYKPTFLKDSSSGDFCDPFGFCQGVLQQVEFAGAVVVHF
jgi:hypothetical protein